MMQRKHFPYKAVEYEGHQSKYLDLWFLWREVSKSTWKLKQNIKKMEIYKNPMRQLGIHERRLRKDVVLHI